MIVEYFLYSLIIITFVFGKQKGLRQQSYMVIRDRFLVLYFCLVIARLFYYYYFIICISDYCRGRYHKQIE